MADAPSPSPYAPGIISDERLPPRPTGRAVPFLVAAFVTALLANALWQLKLASGDAAKFSSRFIGTADIIPGVRNLAGFPTIVWAYLSDRVPLWGTRREGYLALATVTVGAGWLIAAGAGDQPVAWLAIAASLGLATSVARAATLGALAEIGRRRARTGLLAGAYISLSKLGGSAVGLAEMSTALPSIWLVAGIAAGLALAVVLLIIFRSGDDRLPQVAQPQATVGIPQFVGSRVFWIATILFCCATLANVPQTLVWARQRMANAESLGAMLETWTSSGVMLVALLAYPAICRRLPFATLLRVALLLQAGTLAAQAVIAGDGTGAAPELVLHLRAVGDGLASAALLDLAFRSAPRGREASGAILLTSLGSMVTSVVAAMMIPRSPSVPGTAWFATGAAIAGALTVSLLPREIRQARDGRMIGSAA